MTADRRDVTGLPVMELHRTNHHRARLVLKLIVLLANISVFNIILGKLRGGGGC